MRVVISGSTITLPILDWPTGRHIHPLANLKLHGNKVSLYTLKKNFFFLIFRLLTGARYNQTGVISLAQ